MFKHFFLKLFLLILLVFIAGGTYGYFWVKNMTPEKFLQSDFIQEQVKKQISDDNVALFNLLPRFLGFSEEMTYLVLFLNNTEMRPGGGFIGVYGVVKMNKGKMEVIKLEGSETLDRETPEDWKISPPEILKDHLKVDRWYFRDSNWSPDFSESAKQALYLYTGEEGELADEIDAVVGFTPNVVEKLLEITGPLTVQDLEFTSENVTEKLEYEVEYGYDDKGISFHERKQIIKPLFNALLSGLYKDLFNIFDNLEDFEELFKEKHIMVYSLDDELQTELNKKDWTGEVKQVEGDYLLWVDANLAALKTDYALTRTLDYKIIPQEDGKYLARVEMEYQHNGEFDWRTSRYRTYARIFVPTGSEFVNSSGSMAWDRNNEPGIIDQGEELGKQWFGTFIAIEPGETKSLVFEYILPDYIGEQIDDGLYTLFVQKQLGTKKHELTLELEFGNNIVSAEPSEEFDQWNDAVYKYISDLRLDKSFEIGF